MVNGSCRFVRQRRCDENENNNSHHELEEIDSSDDEMIMQHDLKWKQQHQLKQHRMKSSMMKTTTTTTTTKTMQPMKSLKSMRSTTNQKMQQSVISSSSSSSLSATTNNNNNNNNGSIAKDTTLLKGPSTTPVKEKIQKLTTTITTTATTSTGKTMTSTINHEKNKNDHEIIELLDSDVDDNSNNDDRDDISSSGSIRSSSIICSSSISSSRSIISSNSNNNLSSNNSRSKNTTKNTTENTSKNKKDTIKSKDNINIINSEDTTSATTTTTCALYHKNPDSPLNDNDFIENNINNNDSSRRTNTTNATNITATGPVSKKDKVVEAKGDRKDYDETNVLAVVDRNDGNDDNDVNAGMEASHLCNNKHVEKEENILDKEENMDNIINQKCSSGSSGTKKDGRNDILMTNVSEKMVVLKSVAIEQKTVKTAPKNGSKQEDKWLQSLAKLVAYKEENGHCNVPGKWKKDPQLGEWVKFQRRQYSLKKLKELRIHQLEAIGFEWSRSTPNSSYPNLNNLAHKDVNVYHNNPPEEQHNAPADIDMTNANKTKTSSEQIQLYVRNGNVRVDNDSTNHSVNSYNNKTNDNGRVDNDSSHQSMNNYNSIIMKGKDVKVIIEQVKNKKVNDENVEKEKIGSNNAEMEFSDDPKKYSKQLCHLAIGKAAEALSVPKNHIHKRNNNEYSGEKKNHICSSSSVIKEITKNDIEPLRKSSDAKKCTNHLRKNFDNQSSKNNTVAAEEKKERDGSESHHHETNNNSGNDTVAAGSGGNGSSVFGDDSTLINETNNASKVTHECQGAVDDGSLQDQMNVLQSRVAITSSESIIGENERRKTSNEASSTRCNNNPGLINDENDVNNTNDRCQGIVTGGNLQEIGFLSRMETSDKAFKQVNKVQCLNKSVDRLGGSKHPSTTEVTIPERTSNSAPKVSAKSNTIYLPNTYTASSETVIHFDADLKRINDEISKLSKRNTSSDINDKKQPKNQRTNDERHHDHAVVHADIDINTAKVHIERQIKEVHTQGQKNLVGENDTTGEMTSFFIL